MASLSLSSNCWWTYWPAPTGGLGLCFVPCCPPAIPGAQHPHTHFQDCSSLLGQSQAKDGWSHCLHQGSAWPFSLVSKTGNSYLFLFQFYGFFFFNRPTGEGNNRERLNICFHLMSFALALRGCSGEKSLQALIYRAVMKEVMGGWGL